MFTAFAGRLASAFYDLMPEFPATVAASG
jgi:hypothetical protein